MKKIKVLSILTLLFSFVFILASCNSNSTDNPNSSDDTPSTTVYYSLYVSGFNGDIEEDFNFKNLEFNTLTEDTLYQLTQYNKDDYEGWYFDSNYTNRATFPVTLTENTKLYGKLKEAVPLICTLSIIYTTDTYKTYDYNVGTTITEEDFNTLVKNDNVKVEGKKINGFYLDSSYETAAVFPLSLNENTTIYAKFTTLNTLTFHYNDDDDTVKTIEILRGTKVEESILDEVMSITFDKKDFHYENWYTNEACTTKASFPITVRSNFDFYLKWNPIDYKNITYNMNGKIVSEKYEVNTLIKQNDYTTKYSEYLNINGYKFIGWFSDINYQTQINDDIILDTDKTIYAKYELIDKTNLLNKNLSIDGYLTDDMPDFSAYYNTSSHVKVSTVEQLVDALTKAKYDYTTTQNEIVGHEYIIRKNCEKSETNWNNALNKGLYEKIDNDFVKIPVGTAYPGNSYYQANGKDSKNYYEDSNYSRVTYSQQLNKAGTINIIEITADIDLGWNLLSDSVKNSGIINNFSQGKESNISSFTMSDMFTTYGISQVNISRTNNLLIYSSNGSTIKHGGFKISSCYNLAIRNLNMDEIWQWEDSKSTTTAAVGDYDAFGWAYMKINYSGNIWIDHCTFGKSYDGQIDVANPEWDTTGTVSQAPYNAKSHGVHISWCNFTSGSDNQDGYLYKMMYKIETEYKNGIYNNLYYKTLRDSGATFENVLYGLAIPQKKAFLLGDTGATVVFGDGTSKSESEIFNKSINVSIANCVFKNIEDRIPKVRTGNAVFYNNIVDNNQYMTHRKVLVSLGIKAKIEAAGSKWKCGLVSQCILPGVNGSIYVESCIFKGIEALVKNNDTGVGSVIIRDCSYQHDAEAEVETDLSRWLSTGGIHPNHFIWRTTSGTQPFVVNAIGLSNLENHLNGNTGYNKTSSLDFTKIKY